MDTISHAIVGVAVAGFSGHTVSINDPIYLSALIGSQAPDFDIISRFKGKFAYLKQHRSFSHSIPGILLLTVLISLGLSLFFPHDFKMIFIWCFLGCLSHVALDYLNTHGIAFLWPYSKMRQSLNLLNVFDPCLLIMTIFILALKLPPVTMSFAIFVIFGSYIIFRYFLRCKTYMRLKHLFENTEEILILPSLKHIFSWDFIIKTPSSIYVGQIGALRPVLSIRAKLSKEKMSNLINETKKTGLGKFFLEFTPASYFKEDNENNEFSKTVRIYDLRYCFKQGFSYSAAAIFDSANLPSASYFFVYGEKIKTT
jgi:inner membrane protein